MLISTMTAPACLANSGKLAAGWTSPEVPIEKKTSHVREACMAVASSSLGSNSPNQTTSGRSFPPQVGQVDVFPWVAS